MEAGRTRIQETRAEPAGSTTPARIWDLRRGDHDDNRVSTHVHGWRVVLSVLLEFNYLNASITFLTLIIAPALLVGLAPSAAVTYGRLKLEAATLAQRNPALALLLLVVLLGLALWLGRPLIRLALNNFWDLHYALVFPFFVAVCEVLRMFAERFPTRATTVQQIDRRRRFGTVLGTLLLTGGGLALALAVGRSLGFQVVDLRRVNLWVIARTALVNAAVILGVSTAVQSVYWLVRQRIFVGPILDWKPGSPQPDATALRVAHLSDLHLVSERYGYRMEAGTHGPRGNHRMIRVLRQLAAIHASAPLDHIFVSGDVTDDGTRGEWAAFLDLLRGYPKLRARLSFVPGNHDVNVVDRTNPGRMDLPWSAGVALRKLRVVLALDAIQGQRVHVVDRASGKLGPSLADYLRTNGRLERLRALAEHGSIRGRLEIFKVWDAIFPLVEPASREKDYGVILLNSNSRAYFSLTSAIGLIDPGQLRALKALLRKSQGPWAIVLHHHVVEYPIVSITLRDRIGLALVNAPDLLATLAPHVSRLVVFHGHRHWDWIGTCGGLVLCSVPSAMLGSHKSRKYCGSFHIHQLAVGHGGNFRLTATERIEVT